MYKISIEFLQNGRVYEYPNILTRNALEAAQTLDALVAMLYESYCNGISRRMYRYEGRIEDLLSEDTSGQYAHVVERGIVQLAIYIQPTVKTSKNIIPPEL